MSCFNDIAIGVTTDFKQVDLEKRFSMWGVYLWLSIYRIYVRLLCEKQGDENDLNLPISYHPYYTQQAFQVGKRKLDVCLSIGKTLTCKHIDTMRAQETILKQDAITIAYGPEKTTQTITSGRWKKKEVQYDLNFYDIVLNVYPEFKEAMDAMCAKNTLQLMSPYLLAEAIHYGKAAEPQKLSKKPYVMVYASVMNQEIIENARAIARARGYRLLINEGIKEYATKYTRIYNEERLDVIYGVLMDAKYVITDSSVIAGLALERGTLFTTISGQDEKLPAFLDKYSLQITKDFYPVEEKLEHPMKPVIRAAVKELNRERDQAYRILEKLLKLERYVDAPTKVLMSDCYGCSVCRDVCPKGAITMEQDEAGFYYPKTNQELCVKCGLCEKHCIANEKKQFAKNRVSNKDQSLPQANIAVCKSAEQLDSSSSGGVYQSFARYIIEEKHGVVFGAAFDENAHVFSMPAETMEEAKRFSGSKYVKSEFAQQFPKVKEYLEAGREVLYTGLPCENAALRAYLGKEYDKLTQCELICHGGASPKIYEAYINHINRKLKAKVTAVNFRDKTISWHQKDFRLTFSFSDREPFSVRGRQNNYMNAFLKNYIFRMSCYRCQYAGQNRVADITLGDCHGVEAVAPEIYNPRGVSSIIVNTDKGRLLWDSVKDEMSFIETTVAKAYRKNHTRPSVLTEERAIIMEKLDKTPIDDLLKRFNLHDAGIENTEI